MKVGGSPGGQAAQQLLQATNQVASMSTRQLQVANNELSKTKANAMNNTAGQLSAAVERKGNAIDVMA